jgi:hypothetical protein
MTTHPTRDEGRAPVTHERAPTTRERSTAAQHAHQFPFNSRSGTTTGGVPSVWDRAPRGGSLRGRRGSPPKCRGGAVRLDGYQPPTAATTRTDPEGPAAPGHATGRQINRISEGPCTAVPLVASGTFNPLDKVLCTFRSLYFPFAISPVPMFTLATDTPRASGYNLKQHYSRDIGRGPLPHTPEGTGSS